MKLFLSYAGLLAGLFFLLARMPAQAQTPAWQSAVAVSQTTSGLSTIAATATDASGNVFVTGTFSGSISLGGITLTSAGFKDVFVAKWSPASGSFLWGQRAGGTADDEGLAIAINGSSVYIAGDFVSQVANFGNNSLLNAGTAADVFVAKLTDAGATGTFGWAQQAGGANNDFATAVAVNGTSVYIAGQSQNTASFGSISLPGTGFGDIFVAKLTDAGPSSSFVWAQLAGGAEYDRANALAVNGSSVYVTGTTQSSPALFGSASISTVGWQDVFVAKLTDAGSSAAFVWAQRAGGAADDYAMDVAVSGSSVYVTGSFVSRAMAFGSITLVNLGSTTTTFNAFVAKLTDNGTTAGFVWAQPITGAGGETANAIATNGNSVYVTGAFNAFASFGTITLQSAGNADVFVARLTDTGPGASFAWAQRAGGLGYDGSNTVAVTNSGKVYAAGDIDPLASFGSQTLPGAAGTYVAFLASLTDATGLATTSAASLGEAGLSVFPNPTHARATVQLPAIPGTTTATLTILDALGRALHTQMAPTNSKAELDLTGLAPGLYAVRVQAGGRTATQRLVVE